MEGNERGVAEVGEMHGERRGKLSGTTHTVFGIQVGVSGNLSVPKPKAKP